MATFVFDGTSSITAAKTDTVIITANPATFTSVSDNGSNSVFNFGGKLLTITGTTFGANGTSYPNVTLQGGTFSTFAATGSTPAGPNDLIIAPNGTTSVLTTDGTASSVKAIFGGLGVSDPIDGNDTITIGGKGSFLVYGNGGDDNISSTTTAFDSTSAVTTFGGKGTDIINYNNAALTNQNAKFAVYGGEGADTISVQNTGTSANTFIAGGQGAADPTDGNDTIRFIGGGTVNIFANAGDDTVNVGGTNGTTAAGGTAGSIDSTAAVTVHGGLGIDTININVGTTTDAVAAGTFATTGSVKASIVAYGDEGGDTISVLNNAGTTVIYGDTAAADSNGGNDTITYSGQGTATIYAAGGNDSITLNGRGNADVDSTSVVTVFGGNGNDQVTIGAHTDTIGTYNLTLGAGADVVKATTTSAGTVVGQNVTITDYTVGSGGDSINLVTGFASTSATAVTGSFQTLQQALDAAANANNGGNTAGTVGVVAYAGNTYVVVNETAAPGFSATADLAIKLTGVTDVNSVAASVTTTTA